MKNNEQAQSILPLIKKVPYCIDEIEHDEFVRRYKPYKLKNNFLPNEIGKVFWDYYIKYKQNKLNEYENNIYSKAYNVLSEEEFTKLHGEKPWDVANSILETFDTLKYKFNSPEGLDIFSNYQLKLIHIEKENLNIDFNSLSSGEKVLMALVASVYKSTADNHFPDILLLDEVDASLHPSMMKNMLGVIENIFLKQDVKVILVTHSPTTIALAPEESVYVMNRSGLDRIEKKSKNDALNILTEGFATLEQGLTLFDEAAKSPITLITEGRNTNLISKALELHGISGVEVLKGIEGTTGKNQLKTLYDFFIKVEHTNIVIFVWDSDVTTIPESKKNTNAFRLTCNKDNTIAKKGIENQFDESLFDKFTNSTTKSTGDVIRQFDSSRKKHFEEYILSRNKLSDFKNFTPLIEELRKLQSN